MKDRVFVGNREVPLDLVPLGGLIGPDGNLLEQE
jgi:hypothetical protein